MWPPQYCLCKAWWISATIFSEYMQRAKQGAKQGMIGSSNSWMWPGRFTFQLILCFIQSLIPETELLTVVVAYCHTSWKQIWASLPLTMCLRPPGTSQMVVPFGQHRLLITLDLWFWSQRPRTSLWFCWTTLAYSTHFHWLTPSYVCLMLCLSQKYIALVFFP